MADTSGHFLDMGSQIVLYSLVALDTDLNQFNKLCIEQGPFFKTLFVEGVSYGDRFNLKEHALKQAPNASHVSRDYWKKKIPCSDIENIERNVKAITARWDKMYIVMMNEIMVPCAEVHPEPVSGLTLLNTQLAALKLSILSLCTYLLTKSVFLQS
jgi:hypothetical protein